MINVTVPDGSPHLGEAHRHKRTVSSQPPLQQDDFQRAEGEHKEQKECSLDAPGR